MTGLDLWLTQATRHLSKNSAARVRTEIREHYDAAREAAIGGGATVDEASRSALAALGDAKVANCQYRQVLLTSAEARLLREGNWEARAVCSSSWMKWALLAVPVFALAASAASFAAGAVEPSRVLLVGGIGIGLLFSAILLPVYTPARGRIFRSVKWVVMLGMFAIVFGADVLRFTWLLASCLAPLVWMEWTRVSIRRKLPVSEWPKHLYL